MFAAWEASEGVSAIRAPKAGTSGQFSAKTTIGQVAGQSPGTSMRDAAAGLTAGPV